MSKKILAAAVSIISIIAFGIFSLSNAIALEHEMGISEDKAAPLSAVVFCKEARKYFKANIEGARAKGLSLQLPAEDVKSMVQSIKDYKQRVCYEAKYGEPMPLTSAKQLCKEAKKNYRMDIKNTRAKGLSLQIPKDEIKREIRAIKEYRIKICEEAKGGSGPSE